MNASQIGRRAWSYADALQELVPLLTFRVANR